MGRLLLLTASEVARDPRARRTAVAAVESDLDVSSVSLRIPLRAPSRGGRDEGVPLRELRGLYRLARRARWTALLVRRARETRADIVHAHDLDTLPAGWWLARRSGARLVYDAHELYTGFERRPPIVWAWAIRMLEGALARRADAVVTVGEGVAAELRRLHRLPRTPFVVLNCPPLRDVEVTSRSDRPVRAVYQASIGPGRALRDLEDVAAAGVDVTARVLGFEGRLAGVTVAAPVAATELVTALAPYDVGLVIDRPETRNAQLALPNKLFEYLMAGLAVVVPRTAEMAHIVESEDVGVAYEEGELACAVAELAADRGRVDAMRLRARELAVSRFNAEAQRPALRDAWGL